MKEFISNSAEATLEFAAQLARSFAGNEKLLLFGELGAGKTLFIKGIAAGLGMTNYEEAKNLLLKYGSVKKAMLAGSA